VQYVSTLPVPSSYHEPFCGSLASAHAVSSLLGEVPVFLSDANPFLMSFWLAAQDGFDPPRVVTEEDYSYYSRVRDAGDPMTGYVGFACSFGGKFFGGAARTNGLIKPSWVNTMKRIQWLRTSDVHLSCIPYWEHTVDSDSALTYLDPPYICRTPQSKVVPEFDRGHFVRYAEALPGTVIASEFVNDRGWKVVHNWGDTVVRHLNAKPADGTSEVLMVIDRKFSGGA
jgi:DNA adenine methylase